MSTNEEAVFSNTINSENETTLICESGETSELPLHHVTADVDISESSKMESSETDLTEDEQLNTKRSRELKLLLALSKEANLDTNISHKRKSLDTVKLRDSLSSSKCSPDSETPSKKSKFDKFPITAESELESVIESVNNLDDSMNEKVKKEEPKPKETIHEERKNIKDIQIFKLNKDVFCWRCHREGVNVSCETCPRSYHQKCLRQTIADVDNWPCPECVSILKAESTQTRSPAMKGMTLEHLCSLLKFAVKRMIECNGSEPFLHDVNDKDFPEYKKYITTPMNLTLLEKNIKDNLYGSTQAFEADAKWILHNSIIFNSYQSKLTTFAKTILKICKQEMAEIENCPSCYLNANTKKSTWFVEVCPKPHILVWAKLKGFPYWPAKAMCTNSSGMVDVRFFGAHDRAWVPYKECFLYSRRDPNSNKQKRNDIIECMREVEVYISNLKSLYGEFNYAPFKLPYDPENELKQLLLFIPRFKPNAPPPKKRLKFTETKSKTNVRKCEEDDKDDVEHDTKEEPLESTEGYGTDDEGEEKSIRDTVVDISIEDVENKSEDTISNCDMSEMISHDDDTEENNIEAEGDDDTQIVNHSSPDKLLRGNVRTRGGFSSSTGKIKVIPRKLSEESITQKRLSEDDVQSPNKLSRRNSDQSVKSDSSRLSSISDKINRVDIPENVELTLGNSSDFVKTKKPVQVDVDNSELSLSPQHKAKITDKLMKKLSSSDEDLSESKENNEMKSQTDILLEKYKNLVEEKNRVFASTSFGNASVGSREICASSSDEADKMNEEKPDKGDKDKSENDCHDPKKNEKEEYSSNEMLITSTKDSDENCVGRDITKKEETPESSKNEIKIKDIDKTMPTKKQDKLKDLPEQLTLVQCHSASDKKREAPAESPSSNKTEHEKAKDTRPEIKAKAKSPIVTVPEIVSEFCKEFEEKQKMKKDEETRKANLTKERISQGDETISQKQSNSKPVNDHMESTGTEGIEKKCSVQLKENQQKNESPMKEKKIQGTKEVLENDKVVLIKKITEQLDSNSSDDQESLLDDTQIDEAKIRNIIHSSLNKIDDVKKKSTERNINDTKTKEAKEPKKDGTGEDKPSSRPSKRIKLNENEKTSVVPSFKIVPIQSILNKNIEVNASDPKLISSNPILLKKLSEPDVTKPNSSVTAQLICLEIKSEPESSDEGMGESEYMEKKRNYMSALNISEKTDEVAVPKKNEIRTRSKTEEKGKGRSLDNLSKIIEEVATSYNAKNEPRRPVERKTNSQPVNQQPTFEDRKRVSSQENGEIFVKSFAKMPQQPPRPQPQTQPKNSTPAVKTKSNNFAMKASPQMMRKESSQKPTTEIVTNTTLSRLPPTTSISTTTLQTSSVVQHAAPTQNATNKPLESQLGSSGNVLILTQPGVILPTSQHLTYNAGSFVTFVPSQQNMAMVQSSQVLNAMMAPGLASNLQSNMQTSLTSNLPPSLPPSSNLNQNENSNMTMNRNANIEIHRSQNYIPQNEDQAKSNAQQRSTLNSTPIINNISVTNQNQSAQNEVPALIPINDNNPGTSGTSNTVGETETEAAEDEFSLIHSMVPESVSRAISEVLCRPPPKLKPRPPGPLSQVFDSGNPSSAGPVSARINSISHRLGDYFRGMIIEMLEELGKSNTSEATVSSLKHQIETLQHKHSVEMMDIRKNVCTILKDIQGSIAEERDRIIDETRSACEVEALRRIEEAKSKQWCANCSKEAQFYCCWNTSYCDYPCQQKHWAKHMSKCTQHAGQPQPTQTPIIRPQSQIMFRPTTPKTFASRIVAKPTKVYLNRSSHAKGVPTFKSTTGGHLALVDTSNLEFLTNTSLGAKFISSNSILTKMKPVNSTATSSNGAQQPIVLNHKMNSSIPNVKPSPPTTSSNPSNLISDDEMESD